MYRFLLSPRWVGLAVFVVIFGAVCARLGFWQLDRLEHRLDRNEVITANLAVDPVPLDIAHPLGDEVSENDEWKQVVVTGTYDVEHEVTVKFRTRDSGPGADVVTPLVTDSGAAILVDRGWLATQNRPERPDNIPPPAEGKVTVMGWLRPDNGAEAHAVEPTDGQVRAISSGGFADFVPYPLYKGYLELRTQDPAPAGTALEPAPEPEQGQGPHFFYALQWFFFGLIGLVGYVWFARTEAQDKRTQAAKSPAATHDSEPVSPL